MTRHSFTSAFAADLEAYLAFKHATGTTGQSRIDYLRRFDAYCASHDLTVFDKTTVEAWASDYLTRVNDRSWLSYIRDFGKWMALHRDRHAYVLSNAWKNQATRPVPYLLSTQEIARFFAAASHLVSPSPWAWQTIAFFTLMHSCGLRTGEVRKLSTHDIDFTAGTITILGSKGHRDRRLPITAEIVDVLCECDRESAARFPARSTFFITAAGNPVPSGTVGVIFRRVWCQAGLAWPVSGRCPRPYDFRHHFAYANLERWADHGIDTRVMLPYLAVYMGHTSINSTYYYIHTSPDFLASYSGITNRTSLLRFPEVGFR